MGSKVIAVLCLFVAVIQASVDTEQQIDVNKNEDEFKIQEVAPLVYGGEISEINADVNSFADAVKSRSARSTCGYDECNRFCRKLGHARGVCIGTYCQCRFRRRRSVPQELKTENTEVKMENNQNDDDEKLTASSSGVPSLANVLSRSRRSCGAGECNRHCKKLGHARGVCIGTYCQCRSR